MYIDFYLVNNDLHGRYKMDQIMSSSSFWLGICVKFSTTKSEILNTHLGDKRRKQYFININEFPAVIDFSFLLLTVCC